MTSLLTLAPGETSIQKIVSCVRQLVGYVQGFTTAWTTWTPTVTSTAGAITTVGVVTAKFKTMGKTTFFTVTTNITTVGTASGALKITLPNTANSTTAFAGNNISNGQANVGKVNAGDNFVTVWNYLGAFPLTDAQANVVSGLYECQ